MGVTTLPRAPRRRKARWTDSDVLWLLEAAEISMAWMAQPPADADAALLAACWAGARRDLYTPRPSLRRRAVLMDLTRRLVLAKINQDVRPGGHGAPGRIPAPEEFPDVEAAFSGLVRQWGADSVVVARAEAVIHAAGKAVA